MDKNDSMLLAVFGALLAYFWAKDSQGKTAGPYYVAPDGTGYRIYPVTEAAVPSPTPAPAPTPTPAPSPAPIVGGIPISCGALQVVAANIDLNTIKADPIHIAIKPGQMFMATMRTGAAKPGLQNVVCAEYAGPAIVRTMTISKVPCDMTVGNWGYQPYDVGQMPQCYFTVGYPDTSGMNYCQLEPNTTYYVNIKNADGFNDPNGNTCTDANGCGMIVAAG